MHDTVNHYDYLKKHLPAFLDKHANYGWRANVGIISAHGDKGCCHNGFFTQAGIPFEKAMAIYLLTYCNPFSKQVRETKNGWVDPFVWVVDNFDRFKADLPDA